MIPGNKCFVLVTDVPFPIRFLAAIINPPLRIKFTLKACPISS